MLVNFEGSKRINTLVGNLSAPNDLAAIAKQLDIVASEVKEGIDSLGKGDLGPDGFRDDVQDILFTAYGLLHRASIGLTGGRDYVPSASTHQYYSKLIGAGSMEQKLLAYYGILKMMSARCLEHHANGQATLPREEVIAMSVFSSELLKFTYDAGLSCGYPVHVDYAEVVRSNMTKFDTTLEDAELTREKYAAIGVVTVTTPGEYFLDGTPYTVFICKSSHDQIGTDGKEYPGSKWLKSIHFQEPRYMELPVGFSTKLGMSYQLGGLSYILSTITTLCNSKVDRDTLESTVPQRVLDYIEANSTTLSAEAMDAIVAMSADHGTPGHVTPTEELKELMASEFGEEFATMSVDQYREHKLKLLNDTPPWDTGKTLTEKCLTKEGKALLAQDA